MGVDVQRRLQRLLPRQVDGQDQASVQLHDGFRRRPPRGRVVRRRHQDLPARAGDQGRESQGQGQGGRVTMRMPTLLLIAAGLALPARQAAAQNEFHWKGKVAAGKAIEIKGVNGDVSAVAGSGDVEVTAVKHAHRTDPDEVKIAVVEHADGVTICAVYPSDGRRENTCEAGEHGDMSTPDNDVAVGLTGCVAPGSPFIGRTVNGAVEAAHLASDVEANTVNGAIRISTSGFAQAGTVNGSITASLRRANWSDALEFRTVNGGITLHLPADLPATRTANTVNAPTGAAPPPPWPRRHDP